MTDTKRTAKAVARPEAKNPMETLRQAVELAREAGLQVKAVATKNDEGVTTTENL